MGQLTRRALISLAIVVVSGTSVAMAYRWISRWGKPPERMPFSQVDEPSTPSVSEIRVIDGTVGYVVLRRFGSGAARELGEALALFQREGAVKWILDLRGNWGGSLDGAVAVLDHWVPTGTEIGRYADPKGAERVVTSQGPGEWPLPNLVLVNQATASTAEWVAGVLRYHGRVELLGDQTFGKDRVQEIHQVNPTKLKIVTLGKLSWAKGRPMGVKGLEPDRLVPGRLEQMKEALKWVKASGASKSSAATEGSSQRDASGSNPSKREPRGTPEGSGILKEPAVKKEA